MSKPSKNPHFDGLRTVIYYAPDLAKAKDWYSTILGIQPGFDQPFYVGFNVSGYELGLDPAASSMAGGTAGSITYWGVADAQAAFDRLVRLGATEHSAVQEVGAAIRVASVLDPFGNTFGIIENPHFALSSMITCRLTRRCSQHLAGLFPCFQMTINPALAATLALGRCD